MNNEQQIKLLKKVKCKIEKYLGFYICSIITRITKDADWKNQIPEIAEWIVNIGKIANSDYSIDERWNMPTRKDFESANREYKIFRLEERILELRILQKEFELEVFNEIMKISTKHPYYYLCCIFLRRYGDLGKENWEQSKYAFFRKWIMEVGTKISKSKGYRVYRWGDAFGGWVNRAEILDNKISSLNKQIVRLKSNKTKLIERGWNEE